MNRYYIIYRNNPESKSFSGMSIDANNIPLALDKFKSLINPDNISVVNNPDIEVIAIYNKTITDKYPSQVKAFD